MNIAQMMQQAQVMQKKMAELQDQLADIVVTGQAGNGLVQISMTCKGVAQSVKINPGAIDPEDAGMLEDLVKAAINDARAAVDQTVADQTKALMGGMGLPGNIKLPF